MARQRRFSPVGCPLCRDPISQFSIHKNIHACIRSGNMSEIAECFTDDVDINAHEPYWEITPLHIAASGGDMAIVQYLVEKGATVNARAMMGHTPLYVAAMMGHRPVVVYLLSQGANPHISRNETTPEMIARQCGHCRLADYLSVYIGEHY